MVEGAPHLVRAVLAELRKLARLDEVTAPRAEPDPLFDDTPQKEGRTMRAVPRRTARTFSVAPHPIPVICHRTPVRGRPRLVAMPRPGAKGVPPVANIGTSRGAMSARAALAGAPRTRESEHAGRPPP